MVTAMILDRRVIFKAGGSKAITIPDDEGARTRRSGLNDRKSDGAADPPDQPLNRPPACPECGSQKLYKDGLRYLTDGSSVQRWLCRLCGYRFSQPKVELDVFSEVLERPKPHDDLTHDIVAGLNPSLEEPFNDLPFLGREDVASHGRTVTGQSLNTFCDYNSTRRVCTSEVGAKNFGRSLERGGAGCGGHGDFPDPKSTPLRRREWRREDIGVRVEA